MLLKVYGVGFIIGFAIAFVCFDVERRGKGLTDAFVRSVFLAFLSWVWVAIVGVICVLTLKIGKK